MYIITSKVFVYSGMGAWRFLGIPTTLSQEIKATFGKNAKGWGSLPVTATIGSLTWNTSIFPDKKSASYLLPLKASVRKAADIADDDTVTVELTIR